MASLERHYGTWLSCATRPSNAHRSHCFVFVSFLLAGDIAKTQEVKQLFLSVKPHAIIHLAGLQIPTCRANPVLGATVNVIGTLNVFEAVKALAVRP
jgi:FlaA1/EpsC-like NDP-sugar epimerase